MSRRSTPDRLNEARREATRQRLMGERETPEQADRLIARWELQAAQQGVAQDGRYWDSGCALMLAQRRP
jgi:hypothetical protein